jgi:hypothetical protein
MRIIKQTAVAVAAAGLAISGTVAAGGGVAHATTNQSSTGCSVDSGLLVAGLFPTCPAVDSTVVDPTSFKVTANPSIFNVLGGTLTVPLDTSFVQFTVSEGSGAASQQRAAPAASAA